LIVISRSPSVNQEEPRPVIDPVADAVFEFASGTSQAAEMARTVIRRDEEGAADIPAGIASVSGRSV